MSPTEAKTIANIFIQDLEREHETTRKVIAALPEKQLDFKLGEKGRTARELAWHLAASEAWFAEGAAAGDYNIAEKTMSEGISTADIVKFYDSEVSSRLAKVKQLSGEQLANVVSFFGVMNLPNVMYLGFWNSHSIHHRGQLSSYLRAMNAHVPSIYGGSADEPFQMPAEA